MSLALLVVLACSCQKDPIDEPTPDDLVLTDDGIYLSIYAFNNGIVGKIDFTLLDENSAETYSTSSNFSNPQIVEETGSFTWSSYQLTISGLSPNTTYYVKAFAQNSAGISYSDNSMNVTTY